MIVTAEVNDNITKWKGQESLPPAVFDLLEDAVACFPNGTKLTIAFERDTFSTFTKADIPTS